MIKFDYIQANGKEVELSYDESELLEMCQDMFFKMAAQDGLSDAIAWLSGSFSKEAESNAAASIIGESNGEYFGALFESKKDCAEVLDAVKQMIIEVYKDETNG